MSFQIYNTKDAQKWDKIVKSFPDYDVYYLSGYAKACEVHGDGEGLLIYYQDETTRGINVVIKKSLEDGYSYVETPYGYGGFLIEGDFAKVFDAYDRFCKEEKIAKEFIRFHLFYETHQQFQGLLESKSNNIVRSLTETIEEIQKDFEHKVRKNIKKAVSNGLTMLISKDNKYLNDFLNIYEKTMNRKNATEKYRFDRNYFTTLNQMEENIMYFFVLHEETIISCELVLYDKTRAYSFLGGTLNEYFDLRPNDFLKFEIIKWAKNQGLTHFVLGGGTGSDDGIFKYKKSFAPNGVVKYYLGDTFFIPEKVPNRKID